MIKVTVSNNLEHKTVSVDGEKTIREIMENTGMVFAGSRTLMDDTPLTDAELDSSLNTLGAENDCRITCAAGQNNACSVSILGAAAVLESDLTLEQIRVIGKHRPDALTVVNKDDEPVFKISLAETPEGSLTEDGAAFGTAVSMNGNATITISVGAPSDPVGYVAEKYGACLNFIHKLEENALSQMEDVEEERNAIRRMIARG